MLCGLFDRQHQEGSALYCLLLLPKKRRASMRARVWSAGSHCRLPLTKLTASCHGEPQAPGDALAPLLRGEICHTPPPRLVFRVHFCPSRRGSPGGRRVVSLWRLALAAAPAQGEAPKPEKGAIARERKWWKENA